MSRTGRVGGAEFGGCFSHMLMYRDSWSKGRQGGGAEECALQLGDAALPPPSCSSEHTQEVTQEIRRRDKRQAITKDFSQGMEEPGSHLQSHRIPLATANCLPRRKKPWDLRGLRKG